MIDHPFASREQLIAYVREHVLSSAIRRAIGEGKVEVLGGFSSLPPHTDPGFIMLVTSKHGRTWPVAVGVNEIKHKYRVLILDEIPWSLWDGHLAPHNPVYMGDEPGTYAWKQLMSTREELTE